MNIALLNSGAKVLQINKTCNPYLWGFPAIHPVFATFQLPCNGNYKIICDNCCAIEIKMLDLQSENVISGQNDKRGIVVCLNNHTSI